VAFIELLRHSLSAQQTSSTDSVNVGRHFTNPILMLGAGATINPSKHRLPMRLQFRAYLSSAGRARLHVVMANRRGLPSFFDRNGGVVVALVGLDVEHPASVKSQTSGSGC
jgi:hypothetical protein